MNTTMADETQATPVQSEPAGFRLGLRATLLAMLVAFAVGAGLIGWLAWQKGFDLQASTEPDPLIGSTGGVDSTAEESEAAVQAQTKKDVTAAAADAVEAAQKVEKVAEAQGGFDQRIAAMEQRLTRLDIAAQAASGNAARAEGLLIAFATRRAMERGAPLGYLADQLRLRFGDARPNAVRTIIEAARDPVTLDQLMARLEGLSPDLVKAPGDEAFWTKAKREINSLFVIRRETAPSPAPRRRLERAKMFLESGRVEAAVAEVKNMPGAESDQVGDWVRDAERYAAAQAALDLIETTAVLEPRELRDAQGEPVEQRSPAGEN